MLICYVVKFGIFKTVRKIDNKEGIESDTFLQNHRVPYTLRVTRDIRDRFIPVNIVLISVS